MFSPLCAILLFFFLNLNDFGVLLVAVHLFWYLHITILLQSRALMELLYSYLNCISSKKHLTRHLNVIKIMWISQFSFLTKTCLQRLPMKYHYTEVFFFLQMHLEITNSKQDTCIILTE